MSKIFKSVNIEDDIHHNERIAHYFPTSRSTPVIESVMNPGATMVVASYGSGKSLAASVGAIAVKNSSEDLKFLEGISNKIKSVSNSTSRLIRNRVSSNYRGGVILLSGYVRDLPAEICASLNLGNLKSMQKTLKAMSNLKDFDHLAIVWDEFGRHLENLVMDGRTRDLELVQRLAEWAVRASEPNASFTLLLHQTLLAYAENLNRTTQNEWRKIEGRFDRVQFVEDSHELYKMLAKIISDRNKSKPNSTFLKSISKGAVEEGWFDGVKSIKEAEDLISKAWTLSAGALQVLPKLVSRVGQNERSLFNFIENVDLSSTIGMNEVYLSFSDSIQSDVGVGGLHKKWVEAESARSKCTTDLEREIIAAAFLLQIGLSGERRHLKLSALTLAVRSKEYTLKDVQRTIEELISRKLILHRKLNDDISVWHGADVDVSSKVAEERMRLTSEFDLQKFLKEKHPAPFINPIRHNLEKGTSRYLTGHYIQVEDLENEEISETVDSPWGNVGFVICDSADDINAAKSLMSNGNWKGILVIPHEPVQIRDAALEIEALLSLRENNELIAMDPLIETEINELLVVSRRFLELSLNRLTSQRPTSSTWYLDGEEMDVSWFRPASMAASKYMDLRYDCTPKIINQQMVRQKLSRPMLTNRIRLITRVMEHAEVANLGFSDDDGSAEASIYRTILQKTGLHDNDGNGNGFFAEPEDLEDPGLKEVWGIVKKFFTKPGTKSLDLLVEELSKEPIGLAEGVMPIIVMSGYKAFGKCVSIFSAGSYVSDVLGFESTRMFENPADHIIKVYKVDMDTINYLSNLSYVFAQTYPGKYDELIRFTDDCMRKWQTTVAEGARKAKRLSEKARNLLRKVGETDNPADLFLKDFPEIFEEKSYPELIENIEKCRISIDDLIKGYIRDAIAVIQSSLSLNDSEDTLDGVKNWVSCFDADMILHREDIKHTDKAVIRIALESFNDRHTSETLARAFSSILLQRGLEKWQDDTEAQLRKALRECRQRIEDAAMDCEIPSKNLIPIIESRINQLKQKLKIIKKK